VHLSVLCTPGIAAAHQGKDLAAFIEANELVHVRIADEPRHKFWSQFARHLGLTAVNVERGLVVDTAVLAAQYALGGQGIALVDTNLFADHLRSGALVKPFEATLHDGYGYYLTTHPEGLADTAIALFRSWLIERFGTRSGAATPPVQLAVSNA
jgi:DNA-binding transcriptional LysR family regulator